MLTKALKWLDWHTRIWFIDNVWTRIFPPDETPRLLMSAEELAQHKQRFMMGSKAMAKMLHVPVAKFRKWEEDGIYGPGEDGAAVVAIKVIANILNERKEQKEMLDTLGYTGNME